MTHHDRTPKRLTADALDAIAARAADASESPWQWRPDEPGSLVVPNPGFHPQNVLKTTPDWRPLPQDATFIAHARSDIPALLDHIAALTHDLANVRIAPTPD